MDRTQLESDLVQLKQNYLQAREQVLRLEGAMQYAQQRLDQEKVETPPTVEVPDNQC
mgnify:CR=1 FL=1